MNKRVKLNVCLLIATVLILPSMSILKAGDNVDRQEWTIETVDSAGDTGECTSIALDSNDYPHISYGNSDNDALEYARWNGATWDIETVDSPGFGWTSIALDSNDYPHIAYPNQYNEYQKYARWNGATWDIEIVDPVWSYFASIALDSNDYPHISYYEMNNEDLKYAKWNGATWDIETVDSVGDVGEYCSLALDSSDYPHISYRDNDNTLKHAWWDGTLWHIEVVEVIPGSYGVRYSSIAIDSSDKSHIAYKDYENDDLKYAKNTTGTWQTETVDSTGDTGWYLSIALDSSDYPHISFSDWPGYNYRLKYAKWSGDKGWEIEIVDTAMNAGKFTSIALDSNDLPHISYNDGNLDDLKYAKQFGIVSDIPITNLSDNWNFISLPFNQSVSKTDLIVKYSTLGYTWSEAVSYGYVSDFIFGWNRSYQSYTFADSLESGYGYWVYAYVDCELWAENISVTPDNYITDIKQDWNIVGVPYDQNVSKTDILVNDIPWADAVTAGIINDYVFGWSRTGQSYNFADTFMPGYAYWMYAYQACTLRRT